jgi:phosphinothricin acetyltransferase
MQSQWNVRAARPADAARVAEIYNEGIRDGHAKLDMRLINSEQVLALMCAPDHHILAAEWGETVLGWASLIPEREAPPGVEEASVYVSRGDRFQGLGRILMEALIRLAEERGYYKIIGRIFSSNEASRRLCRSFGFREVGVLEKHGRVGDRWVDIVLVERLIPAGLGQPAATEPRA